MRQDDDGPPVYTQLSQGPKPWSEDHRDAAKENRGTEHRETRR